MCKCNCARRQVLWISQPDPRQFFAVIAGLRASSLLRSIAHILRLPFELWSLADIVINIIINCAGWSALLTTAVWSWSWGLEQHNLPAPGMYTLDWMSKIRPPAESFRAEETLLLPSKLGVRGTVYHILKCKCPTNVSRFFSAYPLHVYDSHTTAIAGLKYYKKCLILHLLPPP